MISVIVTYQVKPEFVEQNKKNIHAFLQDFELLDASKFKYSIFLKYDGVSQMRDDSGLNDSHHVEVLQSIGSKGNLG